MIQQVCTFFLNNIYFGIDVQNIQEIIRPQETTPIPLAPPDICGLINLRGQIVTVIDLKIRLEMKQETKYFCVPQYNIIMRIDEELVSLQIDDIGDVLEINQENCEPPPATLQGKMQKLLQSTYKLSSGFLLILDTQKIINSTVL